MIARVRQRPGARALALALAIHAVVGLLDVALLAAGAHQRGFELGERLASWDGGWFLRLATEGYPDHLDVSDPDDQSTGGLAFFPLYPGLIRLVSLTGLPPGAAGVTISVVAGFVAAAGVYLLGARLASPKVGVLAVALWSAMPTSIVLSMVYTEALFTALAVFAVLAAMRERWLLAGVLGLLAGLTRATGLAVGVAVVAALVLAVRRDGRRALRVRSVAGCVLALAGTPVWWVCVAAISGRIDGWFAVQRVFWGSSFDVGTSVATAAWDAFTFRTGPGNNLLVVHVVSLVALLVALVLVVDLALRAWRDQRWVVPAVYALAVLALTIGGAGYLHSKVRFLVPIVPLVLPVALVLARARRTVAIGAVVAFALAGGWWGAFMLTVWRYAI